MTIKSENTFRTSSLVCLWIHKVESDLFCDIDEKLVNMTTVIYIDLLTKNSSILYHSDVTLTLTVVQRPDS